MPPKGVCTFQTDWLCDPELHWVEKVEKDVTKAFCRLCQTSISLSSMGRTALTSHMKGQKHKSKATAIINTPRLADLIPISKTAGDAGIASPSTVSIPLNSAQLVLTDGPSVSGADPLPAMIRHTESQPINKYLLKDETTIAEIIWCLDAIMNHSTVRSAGKSASLFPLMFKDSKTAANMKLQRTKIGYTLVYGLAPYFKNQLLDFLLKCPYLVVGFDESLNKVCQRQQMDLNARFWDDSTDEVRVRYVTSVFLGRCKAVDLLTGFLSAVRPLGVEKVLQVSMDGPNVNLRFFKDLQIKMAEEDVPAVMLDLGSCGIHTTHNAFKNAMIATKWNISTFLRSLYNLLKNVPARRALYTSYTQSFIFPKKFCSVRWLENADVAERAIEMLPHLKKFIEDVEKNKDKLNSSCFSTVKEHVQDPMIGPKLAFFKTIAGEVEPFLREFQSDWPLAPFLSSALSLTVVSVMDRFVKESAIKISVDLTKEDNLIPVRSIEVGFETDKELAKCKKLTDKQLLLYRQDCREALKKFISKMMERSPLKRNLCEAISCFDPEVALKRKGRENLKRLLDILFGNKWISSITAENAAREFKVVTKNADAKQLMENFKRQEQRLDTFWMSVLKKVDKECDSLKQIIKMTLLLSHGNASLERGFSVNGECLVENMLEETLVAHRTIYDSVSALGGIENVPMTKKLILEARNAHSRYKEAATEKQKIQSVAEKQASKKQEVNAKVRLLATKKAQLLQDARKEAESIDKEIEDLRKA